MVTPDLLRFVQRKLAGGSDPQQIRQTLTAHGWSLEDIQLALEMVLPKPAAQAPVRSKPTFDPASLSSGLFKLGFAGVFLVNALVAMTDPGGFIKLMQGSFVGAFIHSFTPLVWLIALNDLVLGLLILSGRWPSYVLAWAGLWLLAVSVIKLSSLF